MTSRARPLLFALLGFGLVACLDEPPPRTTCSTPNPACSGCNEWCPNGAVYVCDVANDRWVQHGDYCSWPASSGNFHLTQTVTSQDGACTDAAVRQAFVLHLRADRGPLYLTADAPQSVAQSDFTDRVLVVRVVLTDDWSTPTETIGPRVTYDLAFGADGVHGTGIAKYGGTSPCTVQLAVTGTWTNP
jgi:hypothetical protein